MKFHPHTAIPINQPHPAKPYEQREYPDNKPLINMKTIRALLSDIIEIIDTLEMLKAPKFPVPVPLSFTSRDDEIPQQSFGGTGIDLITLARTGAAVGNPDQSFPDDLGVTMTPPADDAPVWEKARQAVAEAQVNPDYTDAPADDHTITIGFAAQGEPEAPPAKTRKPRTPAKLPRPEGVAKAPKPEPVDFDAVRVEVAASISSLVEQGKKENIKELLTKFGADRAREISDENIVAFRDELILL